VISSKFLSERPQKGGFYREFMEEQAHQERVDWGVQIFEDSPAKVMLRFSAEDIIVTHGNEGFLPAKVIVRSSPCPVLVMSHGFEHVFQNIILAYAGGRFSDRALQIAGELGKSAACRIQAATVGVSSSPALRLAHEKARYFFERYKVKADFRMLRGQIKKTILELCEKESADLLILGASETDQWKDHGFRSLSEEVLERAGRPVMVVK